MSPIDWILALALLGLLAVLAWLGVRARACRREARSLTESIEALDEGYALFDAEDRLVTTNEAYRRTFPKTNSRWQTGDRFDELLKLAVEAGEVPEAVGCEDEWMHERLARRANPGPAWTQVLPDGRTIRVRERRTASGAMVALRADISELAAKERALTASQAQLQAIIGRAGVAILTVDAQGLIRSANPATVRMLGYEEVELLGQPVSMLVDHVLRKIVQSFLDHYLENDDAELPDNPREFPCCTARAASSPCSFRWPRCARMTSACSSPC